jgi:chaperonin cofactor prefoldin
MKNLSLAKRDYLLLLAKQKKYIRTLENEEGKKEGEIKELKSVIIDKDSKITTLEKDKEEIEKKVVTLEMEKEELTPDALEFREFKQTKIWKGLQKYREIKKKIF